MSDSLHTPQIGGLYTPHPHWPEIPLSRVTLKEGSNTEIAIFHDLRKFRPGQWLMLFSFWSLPAETRRVAYIFLWNEQFWQTAFTKEEFGLITKEEWDYIISDANPHRKWLNNMGL